MLVNDLLAAASLRLAAREGARAVGLVSPYLLADLVREISGALAAGRDPWAEPMSGRHRLPGR